MEDRENERKGTASGAETQKKTLMRERGRKPQDRGIEMEKEKKKSSDE